MQFDPCAPQEIWRRPRPSQEYVAFDLINKQPFRPDEMRRIDRDSRMSLARRSWLDSLPRIWLAFSYRSVESQRKNRTWFFVGLVCVQVAIAQQAPGILNQLIR